MTSFFNSVFISEYTKEIYRQSFETELTDDYDKIQLQIESIRTR